MIKFIRLVKRQILAHPIAVLFLMFGYLISVLLISLGVSNLVHTKNLAMESTEGLNKNTLFVGISVHSKSFFNNIDTIFKDISQNDRILFKGFRTYINNKSEENMHDLICELYFNDPEWKYPLLSGRYYNLNELKNGSKVVLLGKNLTQYIQKKDSDKNMIYIGGEEYEVIGIIGKKDINTPWDEQLFMPIKSASSILKNNTDFSISFYINNMHTFPINDCNIIKNNIGSITTDFNININEFEKKDDLLSNIFSNNLLLTSTIIYVVAVINIINLTAYWIKDRRREIGIKKAFGISDRQIASLLFTEVFSLMFVVSCIAILIQYGMSLFTDRFFGFPLELSKDNLIAAILSTLVTTIITATIPIIKSYSINPIEILKY